MPAKRKRNGSKNLHKKEKFKRHFVRAEKNKIMRIERDKKRKLKAEAKNRHKHVWFISDEGKWKKTCQGCDSVKYRKKKASDLQHKILIKDGRNIDTTPFGDSGDNQMGVSGQEDG